MLALQITYMGINHHRTHSSLEPLIIHCLKICEETKLTDSWLSHLLLGCAVWSSNFVQENPHILNLTHKDTISLKLTANLCSTRCGTEPRLHSTSLRTETSRPGHSTRTLNPFLWPGEISWLRKVKQGLGNITVQVTRNKGLEEECPAPTIVAKSVC